MKTIRNIIRESVRRMSLPTTRVHVQNKNKQQQMQQHQLQHQKSLPIQQQQHFLTQTGPMLAQHGTKRPDNLTAANKGGTWTMDKKTRGKQLKSDLVRHSMDMDDIGSMLLLIPMEILGLVVALTVISRQCGVSRWKR